MTVCTNRLNDAFAYAHHLHQQQKRKGTDIPYISHLMAVASLALEHGGSEGEAIAALLHDAAEDQGGEPTLAEIWERFKGGKDGTLWYYRALVEALRRADRLPRQLLGELERTVSALEQESAAPVEKI